MASVRLKRIARIAARRPIGRGAVAVAIGVALTSCGFVNVESVRETPSTEQDVVAAAGWTRIAATEKYLVVANVLAGEEMFTAADAATEHPLEGELIVSGTGRPLGANARHIEAHIYDRKTGMPLADLKPTIVIVNRTTSQQIRVESTLMQDLNIGPSDIHYGNNVAVEGNSDLRLTITVGDQEVTFDGHLD